MCGQAPSWAVADRTVGGTITVPLTIFLPPLLEKCQISGRTILPASLSGRACPYCSPPPHPPLAISKQPLVGTHTWEGGICCLMDSRGLIVSRSNTIQPLLYPLPSHCHIAHLVALAYPTQRHLCPALPLPFIALLCLDGFATAVRSYESGSFSWNNHSFVAPPLRVHTHLLHLHSHTSFLPIFPIRAPCTTRHTHAFTSGARYATGGNSPKRRGVSVHSLCCGVAAGPRLGGTRANRIPASRENSGVLV